MSFGMADPALKNHALRGQRNQLAGCSAEGCVERRYREFGHQIRERRWRGEGGEIDLILQGKDGTIIFVEVKKARNFDQALARITPQKVRRLHQAAEEYLGGCPNGALSDTRFDAAAVDVNGQVQIHVGALLAY